MGLPIMGCIGDQQSALVGQLCFSPGDAKTTYGTGCFMLFNTGTKPVLSKHGLLTTVAYQFGKKAPVIYALEGSVAVAGSGITWLRDNMGIVKDASELDALVESVDNTGGVYFVPALSGLFAPYWRADATGLVCGLTQHSTRAHLLRAFIKAVCFQNLEVLDACYQDSGVKLHKLCVDGGMTASKSLLQIQSDLLNLPVIKPADIETTARGASIVAALASGFWKYEELDKIVSKESQSTEYHPKIDQKEREKLFKGWKRAVGLSYAK
jgi:glycerol kinase